MEEILDLSFDRVLMMMMMMMMINPSGRNMAVELSQHLREISTRNISWGVKVAGA